MPIPPPPGPLPPAPGPAAVDPLTVDQPTIRATVGVGMSARPLSQVVDARLRRVVVDADLHLPDMFELTFADNDGTTLGLAGIAIGALVTVSGPVRGSTPVRRSNSPNGGSRAAPGQLIQGEVTAIEGMLSGVSTYTVVRGYSQDHRLQRATRSRTFLNSTDSDIARQVATGAGLRCGTIVATQTTHPYVGQFNQTDWDFLASRAADIGYEFGVASGLFYFRPASTTAAGGATGAVRAAASRSVAVAFPDSLFDFRPRITAGNLTPDVEVRVWDPMARYAYGNPAAMASGAGTSPATLGRQFVARPTGLAGAAQTLTTGGVLGSPLAGMLGMLGTPPSPTAYVVNDHPVASGTAINTAGPAAALALGADLGSTYAEAEGEADGNSAIQPGAAIDVSGVPASFAGRWMVSRAIHVFDDSEHGYRTTFSSCGRQDRTMLGLTAGVAYRRAKRPTVNGIVAGVVSNVSDPLNKARVKVTLPWLSPDFDTDWAPVVQFCAGTRTGAQFLPEVGDEVMVAFEHGDVRRPYVVGGLVNNFTGWSLETAAAGLGGMIGAAGSMMAAAGGALGGTGGMAANMGSTVMSATDGATSGVMPSPGRMGEIVHRGFVSSTGNGLVFEDLPAVGAATAAMAGGAAGAAIAPQASAILLGSQTGMHGLGIDAVNAAVTLKSTAIPGVAKMPIPRLDVSSMNGAVTVGAGPAGYMVLDGGLMLTQKAMVSMSVETAGVLNVEAAGDVTVAGAAVTITGGVINLDGLVLVNGIPLV